MSKANVENKSSTYPLATGSAGADRLRLMHRIYGADTQRLLLEAGLRGGMRVADIGCGIGTVTRWIAQQVGSTGHVTGVDASPAQIEVARADTRTAQLDNIEYVVADALALNLPVATFDLVYCRLLLCHLARPLDALRQMRALLKPGATLVCEELDLMPQVTEPPQARYDEIAGSAIRDARARGADYNIGRKLPRLFAEVGLGLVGFRVWEPAYLRGEEKRIHERSLAEEFEKKIAAGLMTSEQADVQRRELARVSADDTILVFQTRMAQAWGR